MTLLKNSYFYSIFIILFIGMLAAVIPIHPYIAVAGCIVFSVITFLLVSKKTIHYDHMVILLLGTVPFIHSVSLSGIEISLPDILLILCFCYLLIFKKTHIEVPKKFLIIASLYTIYYFIALYWTDDIFKSIPRLVQYVEFCIIGVIVFYNTKRADLQKRMLITYIAVSTILSLIGIVIYAMEGASGALYVLGLHKNALGWIVGAAIPVIFGMLFLNKDKKIKTILILTFLLNFFTLVLTVSRGALLGAIAGLFVLLILINKKRLLLLVSLITSACLFVFIFFFAPYYVETGFSFDQGSSAYTRVLLFEHVISYIKEQPLLGYGAGNYIVYLPHFHLQQDDPNNSFLLNLVEGGVAGLVLFIVLIGYVFAVVWENKKKFEYDFEKLVLNAMLFAVFLGRFVHTQVDVTWVRGSSLLMFAAAGMILALNAKSITAKEGPEKLP